MNEERIEKFLRQVEHVRGHMTYLIQVEIKSSTSEHTGLCRTQIITIPLSYLVILNVKLMLNDK